MTAKTIDVSEVADLPYALGERRTATWSYPYIERSAPSSTIGTVNQSIDASFIQEAAEMEQ